MPVDVKHQWETLVAKYTTDAAVAAQLWEELEQAHTARNRYYHTLDHLAYMLELAENYKQDEVKYEVLQFAIFYHDIVYNPSRADNEEESAELAEKRLKTIGLSDKDIKLVKEAIIATNSHKQHQESTINFMLDLDLAILGAAWQKYDEYRQDIRKEYSVYPDEVYQSGRKSILQNFLAQPYIYKTPLFHERLEEQARENIRMELDML